MNPPADYGAKLVLDWYGCGRRKLGRPPNRSVPLAGPGPTCLPWNTKADPQCPCACTLASAVRPRQSLITHAEETMIGIIETRSVLRFRARTRLRRESRLRLKAITDL